MYYLVAFTAAIVFWILFETFSTFYSTKINAIRNSLYKIPGKINSLRFVDKLFK